MNNYIGAGYIRDGLYTRLYRVVRKSATVLIQPCLIRKFW